MLRDRCPQPTPPHPPHPSPPKTHFTPPPPAAVVRQQDVIVADGQVQQQPGWATSIIQAGQGCSPSPEAQVLAQAPLQCLLPCWFQLAGSLLRCLP